MHVLCTSSTDLQASLPIDDSSGGQEIAITNNVAVGTYDFMTDPHHPDSQYVTEGNYIAFRDKYGKDRLYTIMSVDGEDSWDVHCEDIGLDLINEDAIPWDYTGNPKTIEDTLEPVIYDSGWKIGINEVSGYKRATKFEGTTDSQLTRIGDVCGNFDCECEFDIAMKGSNVIKQTINIYKTLGQDMTQQRFVDGINLISLRKSGTIEDLITCVRCHGREDENGNKTTIAEVEYDDGDFYTPKGDIRIYSREARKKWSRFRAWNYEGQGEFDGYINGTFEYDTDDPQELFNRGLSDLKERCEKKVSYEAKLYDLNADIGDTIRIADNRFSEKVYLSARIQAVKNHYSVQGEDTGTLANYKILTANPASGISDMINKIKNQIVSVKGSIVSYQIGDSGTEVPTGEWGLEIPEVPAGKYLWTRTETMYSDGSKTTAYSISRQGEDGGKGDPGTSVTILGSYETEEELNRKHPAGELGDAYIVSGDLYVWNGYEWENVGRIQGPQGEKAYIHTAYANSEDGHQDFSLSDPTGRAYMGQYADYKEEGSENPDDYKWMRTKGEDGKPGENGKPGIDGMNAKNYVIESTMASLKRSANGFEPARVDFIFYSQEAGKEREQISVYAQAEQYVEGEWKVFWNWTSSSELKTLVTSNVNKEAEFVKLSAYGKYDTETDLFSDKYQEITLPVTYHSKEISGTYSSDSEPKSPFTGMLWKNTGTDNGYVKNAIYQWDGNAWNLYYFSAKNLDVDTLSAITAVLGEVISGKITNTVDDLKAIEILENQINFYDYTNTTETFAGSIRGAHIGSDNSKAILEFILAYGIDIFDALGNTIMNIHNDGVDVQKDLYLKGRNMTRVFDFLPDDTKGTINDILDTISYTGTEIKTDKTWFGSPIYKKTINAGKITSESKAIDHGVENLNVMWVDPAGSFLMSGTSVYPFPRISAININQNISWHTTPTQLILDVGTNANFDACYVTLLYIKKG